MEGFWKEHGPYLVRNAASGVAPNPLGLTKLAHMLYLEHPVGVGFSYAENKADYLEATLFSSCPLD